MRNWLIKLLGGISREDYSLLKLEYQSQRDLTTALRKGEEDLLKILHEIKEERNRLQEIIFKNYGVVTSEEKEFNGTDKELQPIRTSPQRWSALKGKLESDDRARAFALFDNALKQEESK
jgi:hypothetical protein